MQIKFTVLGEPQGKGRPKFSRQGGFVKTYTPDKTVLYENLIRTEYLRQCSGQRFADKELLAMKIRAYIIKVVADSLNQVAYRDDADLVKVELEKFYSWQPRIEVEIKSLEE